MQEAQRLADELRQMPRAQPLWDDVEALLAQADRQLNKDSDVENLIGLALALVERLDEDEVITAKAA